MVLGFCFGAVQIFSVKLFCNDIASLLKFFPIQPISSALEDTEGFKVFQYITITGITKNWRVFCIKKNFSHLEGK